jgi:site-specific DNA recombinase
MLALGLQSKREITRNGIRVRAAMATQTLEQGRYLGGRPPFGYRLADAGPHPNKAHAACGRRAHRLEPDPATAPVVAGCSPSGWPGTAPRGSPGALNDTGIPCPSAVNPARNPHRSGTAWTLHTVAAILANPRYTAGRHGTGSTQTSTWSNRPTPGSGTNRCSGETCPKAGSSPASPHTRRWSARPISSPPRKPPRRAARAGPATRLYLLAGLLAGGRYGRRLESAWSNGRPAYRCRHGHTSATGPDPSRPKNTYVREDQARFTASGRPPT